MEEAAWREGIDTDGPLGTFVRAMHRAIMALAVIAERRADGVVKTVQDARLVVEAEAVKARKTNELAFLAMEGGPGARTPDSTCRRKCWSASWWTRSCRRWSRPSARRS